MGANTGGKVVNYEEETLKQAEKNREWHIKYDSKIQQLLEEMDELLKQSDYESRKKLVNIFLSDENKHDFWRVDAFAYMFCIVSIYLQEEKLEGKHCVLDLADSVQGFIDVFVRIKFLLWRIELENDKEALNLLITFMDENSVSPQFIEEMIRFVSIDKYKVLIKLADELISHKHIVDGFHILWYAKDVYPQDKSIIKKLIDVCKISNNVTLENELTKQL